MGNKKKPTMWNTETFTKEMKKRSRNIEIIGEYINAKTKIKCLCLNCKNPFYSTPGNLLSNRNIIGCRKCSTKEKTKKQFKTHEQFMMDFYKKNRNATNLNILGKYSGHNNKIDCMCNIDKYKWSPKASDLLSGCGCPVCGNLICVEGINDIATLRPDLIKYFVNADDSKKYTLYSNKKVLLKCLDCGSPKEMIVSNLTYNGFNCNICSDSISYPNKFLRGLLLQLPKIENIIYEYSPQWANRKKYDGYFEYNNQKYIIEMDGAWHKQDNNMSGVSAQQSQRTDREKDYLAIKNNHNIIRIDCCKSSCDYIKNNIKNSLLNELFDLNKINWDKCDEFATHNIVRDVCSFYKEHNTPVRELVKIFKLSKSAITKYLNIGTTFDWCDYSGERELKKSIVRTVEKRKAKNNESIVAKDKNNKIVCQSDNIYKLLSILNDIYPDKNFSLSYIRMVCRGKRHTHQGLKFEYIT